MTQPTAAVSARAATTRPFALRAETRVSEKARHGMRDGLTMLNGGSYGAVPEVVRAAQVEWLDRIEQDPVRFFKHDLEGACDEARHALAGLMNCDWTDLALVPNGTVSMSTAIQSMRLGAGDEVVVTDHEYKATINELSRFCARSGARIVIAKVPFEGCSPEAVLESIRGAMTARTRLVIASHIASATGFVFPANEICAMVRSAGAEVLIDGAHGPGQIACDLNAMQPSFYAASCHKWLGAPKGSGFLYVDPDLQKTVRPVAMSCRTHLQRPERKAFLCDFDYVGTSDSTANLVLPVAIAHLSAQHPDGLAGLMRRNHETAMAGAKLVADAIGIEVTVPESMTASIVSLGLPERFPAEPGEIYDDALWDRLAARGMHAPVWGLDGVHPRLMRLSCQWFNTMADFELLAEMLPEELG